MNIIIKHEFLRNLRESRLIPQKAMSLKLGITQEEYLNFETNDNEVDTDFANKVASVFKRNWSVFLLDNPPISVTIDHDNRISGHQRGSFHNKTIEAIEDADFLLGFSENFEDGLSKLALNLSDANKLNAEDMGNILREKSAITIDNQMKFKSDSVALKTWISFIESQGIFVSQYPLDEDDNIRAFSKIKNGRAIIVLNSLDTYRGRSFSLFHEYGHILRRTSGICDLYNSGTSAAEVYCNLFSAAFLVPINTIKDYISSVGKNDFINNIDEYVSRISSQLKVSNLVIYRRLLTLSLIRTEYYSEIHDKSVKSFIKPRRISEDGGGDYYATRRVRNGVSYSNGVFNALDSGRISITEAGNALGVGINNLYKYRTFSAQNG